MPVWSRAPNNAGGPDATGATCPVVNAQFLHLHIGIDAVREPASHMTLDLGMRDLLREAIASAGVEPGGMDTPISNDPDTGFAWRARFDVRSLVTEQRMLQTAAYVVCAYFIGMRDGEVQAMQRGCLAVTRGGDGHASRYAIRSTSYKGRASAGNPEE